MNNIFKDKRGLGFIEMIAALGVIVTGVIAGLTLTTHNLVSSSVSEAKLVAANLARESIEVIRNKRDSNWLANSDWYQGILTNPDSNYRLITEFTSDTNNWSFTDINTPIESCAACQVYFDNSNGIYNHDDSKSLTEFKRLVTLREICWQDLTGMEAILDYGDRCDNHAGVSWAGYYLESEVTWFETDQAYNLTIVDKLYDWK